MGRRSLPTVSIGPADETNNGFQKGSVVETALREIMIGTGLQAAQPILIAIFIRYDDYRQLLNN